MPSIRAVGYRQVWEYLDGRYDYEEMCEAGMAATRQLAKRQLTWLRGWHDLRWVNTLDKVDKPLSFDEILDQTLNIIGERAI
jgi:tRNA dimethylallyltransferase